MTEPLHFPVAIVGAADNLALQEFLATVPADSGIAYLVVAPPGPAGELEQLLQAQALPSQVIGDQAELEPNHLYLLPADRTITAAEPPCCIVTEPSADPAPVDACCRLLAPLLGVYALGVVLGGDGADGALGLTHIREAGGLAAVQEPRTTVAAAGPLHALAAGPVDLLLPAVALGPRLAAYGRQLMVVRQAAAPDSPLQKAALHLIQAHMLQQVHCDLRVYSPQFVLDRIQKRRMVLDLPDLAAYAHLLGEQVHEAKLLRQEILCRARQLFRQPQELAGLAHHALEQIVHTKENDDQVRVWVVGCGTGEEAYTIGILLLEAATAAGKSLEMRIFATDASQDIIHQARAGLFPATIAAGISAERAARFLLPEGDLHRIVPDVRRQLIFAPHDPFQSPPFLKLDLIVCRNLLGTLNPEWRQQLAGLFHQCLLPQGYLFTGAGEEVDAESYRAVDPGLPLYQRQAGANTLALPLAMGTAPRTEATYETLYNRRLQRHAPPGLLVDGNFNIVYYAAGVSAYLHQPGGGVTERVLDRVRPELRNSLAAALLHAAQTGAAVRAQPVTLTIDGHKQTVVPSVEAIGTTSLQKLLMVLFRDAEPATGAPATGTPTPLAREDDTELLQRALAAAYQQLQAAREEYATMGAEMSATNEELMSANEELHLKAVELKQREEDLQLANEELLTINRENHQILEQLRQLSANLQNLMIATDIPTIFVDRKTRIRWFSPAVQDLFNLLPGDEGRPLTHITHHLHYDQMLQDINAVMAAASPMEREIASADGGWRLVRVLPYRTDDHLIDGAVLTFFDITERKGAEAALRQLNFSLEQRVEERTLELMRSNRELDQFAYIASHDLKAPLRAITNLAEWIQKDNAGVLPPASQEHLNKLRARVTRMERLLEDLLTYSRVGRQHHELEWVDIAALIRGLRHVLVAPADFRIELHVPLPVLHTERVPLETILRNLIGNAIKHHDRPGEGVVEVSATEHGEWVEFTIKDNGPGIAPQHHERIFQIFQSLRPHDEVEGSGMGLAIAKKAVESHGGVLQVESQPGQGATFRFTWPRDASPTGSAGDLP